VNLIPAAFKRFIRVSVVYRCFTPPDMALSASRSNEFQRVPSLTDLPTMDLVQYAAFPPRVQPFRPDGQVIVHFPNLQSISVDYNRRESIESFRARHQALAPQLRIKDFMVVSARGAISDGATLDAYYLTPGSNLILIRKGFGNRQQLMSRSFWLKSHSSAVHGQARPITHSSVLAVKKSHRPTPYRAIVARHR
jgi:hypothetical protein